MNRMDKKKPEFGLLIDYEYCTGCHSCEVACAQEYQHKPGVRGIRVSRSSRNCPMAACIRTYFPFPTETCILCPHLTKEGLEPACAKHCMAACMKYGRIEEPAAEVGRKSRMVLWVAELPSTIDDSTN